MHGVVEAEEGPVSRRFHIMHTYIQGMYRRFHTDNLCGASQCLWTWSKNPRICSESKNAVKYNDLGGFMLECCCVLFCLLFKRDTLKEEPHPHQNFDRFHKLDPVSDLIALSNRINDTTQSYSGCHSIHYVATFIIHLLFFHFPSIPGG